jgi:glutamate transport system permease protein
MRRAALGLSEGQVFFLIVFPQALRYIVPALVAQLVIVVKDTTFGYVVTYGELMQNAKVLIANYHSLVPVYLVVAVLYCLVNYAISRASKQAGAADALRMRRLAAVRPWPWSAAPSPGR